MADENGSSIASSNEEFKKFLDEPLSTTESEHADSSLAIGTSSSKALPLEKKEISEVFPSHTWLKKPKAAVPSLADEIVLSSKDLIRARGNDSKVKITLEKEDSSESIIETEKTASSNKSSPRISLESSDKSLSEHSNSGKSQIKQTVNSKDSHRHSSESSEKSHSERLAPKEEHASESSNSDGTSRDSKSKKSQGSKKSSLELVLSNADYSSEFEEEDNSSDILTEEKVPVPASLDAAVHVSGDDGNWMPKQQETKDHSFLDMVLHSEKVENDIIQELKIDEKQLNVRDVLQESSESSDSEKVGLEPTEGGILSEHSSQEDLGGTYIDAQGKDSDSSFLESKDNVKTEKETEKSSVPVTKIPTRTRRVLENKQTKERIVSFSRGVLSASEKKLEKEIEELRREIEEQETLIRGYQNENEKLYSELKHEKKAAQVTETKWRIETEKLKMEVGKLRVQGPRFEIGKRKVEHPVVHEQADYSTELQQIKEACEREKKKSKELHERMSRIQKQTDELSQENEGLAKTRSELLERNKLLTVQLRETETVSAKWKFETGEAKQREDELRKEISRKEMEEKSLTNRSLETQRLQLQVKRILKELEEKDSSTKMILDELGQQYDYIKQRYQKHLQDAGSEDTKKIREMGLKLQMLEKQLQETEEKYVVMKQKTSCPSSYRSIGVQANHFESADLENKEMKLKLERLTLQLEDLEAKHGRLQAEKLKCNTKMKADPKQHELLKKVCKQERKHSSMVVHLQNRIENLEILTNHLSSQLEESEKNSLLLSDENRNLKKTVEDFRNELLPKPKRQSVEGKTILQIEKNIFDLQGWHQKRETALWAATANTCTSCGCSARFQSELSKWQERVIEKNLEIDVYRRELDTLVGFLQQSQDTS